jgi:bifunctional DNA-binding transcriptional regulator/antitoxin component of YhaV-PrlF toxin-antitoxin module
MGVFQLSRKGRLLISRQMRKRLGLKPGGRIQVTEARDTFS